MVYTMVLEKLRRVYLYVFGPSVNRIHKSSDGNNRTYYYEQNDIERPAQRILTTAYVLKLVLIYTMPLWAWYAYNEGNRYFTKANFLEAVKYFGWGSAALVGTLLLRAYGRSKNQEYVTFLDILQRSLNDPGNGEKKKRLRRYDFGFKYFPVDYAWEHMEERKSRPRISNWKRISSQHSNIFTTIVLGFPKEMFAYIIAHTFGVRLLYPGCVKLLHAAMNRSMWEARSTLVEKHGGRRSKLRAEDGNLIDTIFIDRRHRTDKHRFEAEDAPEVTSRHAETLVICCEGSAGFYEGGCMGTPLDCGFSVLGWNHPGFMHSTGMPFPEADDMAMDMVMQYALHKLNFPPKKILLYGWSMGAYTAITAAVANPEVRGVILDGAYHDLLPLVRRKWPWCLGHLVHYTVRNYFNMNNCENLREYSGPVLFIRRTKDEVMNIRGRHVVSSNAGNKLLEDFLRHRFPNLFEDRLVCVGVPGQCSRSPQLKVLNDWFTAIDAQDRDDFLNKWGACSLQTKSLFFKAKFGGERNFAAQLGNDLTTIEKNQLVLFLANKYMRHYEASHCTALAPFLFGYPWRVESLFDQSQSRDSSDSEAVHQPGGDF